MPEKFKTSEVEIIPSVETPSNTATVSLPDIEVGEKRIRLGMHTDSILTLLRTFNSLPDSNQVKIEGRILNLKQESLLLEDPVYNFVWII